MPSHICSYRPIAIVATLLNLKAMAKSNGNLLAIAYQMKKSENYCYENSWKSKNLEIAIKKRSKELIPKKKQRRLKKR